MKRRTKRIFHNFVMSFSRFVFSSSQRSHFAYHNLYYSRYISFVQRTTLLSVLVDGWAIPDFFSALAQIYSVVCYRRSIVTRTFIVQLIIYLIYSKMMCAIFDKNSELKTTQNTKSTAKYACTICEWKERWNCASHAMNWLHSVHTTVHTKLMHLHITNF